ncbi:MAG: N-6 DNA methylase, partial [Chlorobium sp.]|nr:N-6 DNA methylase [Chlorobium sp.]
PQCSWSNECLLIFCRWMNAHCKKCGTLLRSSLYFNRTLLTPRTVVKLLVTILDPAQDAEICDPTVGSGGMLIESFNSVESKYGSARKLTLYGQEKNGTTWGLCKLNMLFHDTNAITTPPLRGTPPEEGNQEDELREQIPLPRRGGRRSLTGWSRQQS